MQKFLAEMDRKRIGMLFFYLGITLELIVMLVNSSAYTLSYGSRLQHLAFGCFMVKLLLTKYEKREWIIIGVAIAVTTLFYLVNGEELLLCIATMILASKGVEQKRVIKYIFWTSLFALIVITTLSLLGIGGPITDIRDYGRGGIEARWCLGYVHPNVLHGTVWFVVAVGIYGYYEKLKWSHYLLLTLFNIGLYSLTISRTGIAVTQVVIFAAWIVRYYPKVSEWKWTYLCGYLSLAVCMLLTLIGVTWGTAWSPIMMKINSLLSGRLEFIHWWADISRWHLFRVEGTERLVDNGFAILFCGSGILMGCFYLLLTVLLIRFYQIKKDIMGLTLMITCILYTLMEGTFTLNSYMLLNFTYVLLINQWYRLGWKGNKILKGEKTV